MDNTDPEKVDFLSELTEKEADQFLCSLQILEELWDAEDMSAPDDDWKKRFSFLCKLFDFAKDETVFFTIIGAHHKGRVLIEELDGFDNMPFKVQLKMYAEMFREADMLKVAAEKEYYVLDVEKRSRLIKRFRQTFKRLLDEELFSVLDDLSTAKSQELLVKIMISIRRRRKS
jgi:hypothetical protein